MFACILADICLRVYWQTHVCVYIGRRIFACILADIYLRVFALIVFLDLKVFALIIFLNLKVFALIVFLNLKVRVDSIPEPKGSR